MKLRNIIAEIFCPSNIKCIMCGNEVFDNSKYSLCNKCTFPINDNFCISCGRGIVGMGSFCDFCKESPCNFTAARSPFIYTDEMHQVVYKLKYGYGKYIADIFAAALADNFSKYKWDVDQVTFVPMHKKRLKKRGYNQAELIAKGFCERLELPLIDCLNRVKYTTNLARMNLKKREEAIKGAIGYNKEVVLDKRVLIIDDVFTSGTTVGECAKILKKNGAQVVYVLTFATSQMKPVLY